jgi:hypothetical protein
MRPASSKPPPLGVQRSFLATRLGRDCQARAYEQVLPVVRRSGTRAATAVRNPECSTETQLVPQGGIAA